MRREQITSRRVPHFWRALCARSGEFLSREFRLILAQPFDLARNNQVLIPAKFDAVLGREFFGALRHKIHMRTLTQNLPRRPHRIAQPFHASHTAGAQRGSIHDERVELHAPVAIQKAAPPGVKSLVIFHDDDGLLDRIKRRAAALEHAPSRSQRVVYPAQVRLDHVIRHGPRPAVHHQYRISHELRIPSLRVKRLARIPYSSSPSLITSCHSEKRSDEEPAVSRHEHACRSARRTIDSRRAPKTRKPR